MINVHCLVFNYLKRHSRLVNFVLKDRILRVNHIVPIILYWIVRNIKFAFLRRIFKQGHSSKRRRHSILKREFFLIFAIIKIKIRLKESFQSKLTLTCLYPGFSFIIIVFKFISRSNVIYCKCYALLCI